MHSLMRGAIVAMNTDHVIGINGDLPWHYADDLKRFKKRTLGHSIIMGRLTWESLGCKALPNRRNIVISRNIIDNVETYPSIEQALDACKHEDIWFIGGGQIYRAAMQYINLLDVTYVPDKINADDAVTFPQIDETQWHIESTHTFGPDNCLKNIIYTRN